MNTPTTAASDFGSNQWLVEEMYEQYKSDKNSVDKSWWPVFERFDADGGASSAGSTSSNGAQRSASSAQGSSTSSGKAAPATKAASATPAKAAPAKKPSAPAPAADKDTTTDRGVNPSTSDEETVKAESKSAGAENLPERRSAVAEDVEDVVTKLRGPAKLIASNMDESLTVPTATSVRSLPAKALIDNRIVINSHLKRTRGGKVSYTHIIAYAMVRALREFPSQNVYYDVQDGKPVMVQPGHVNLGIAIDVPKKDGSRTLLVPNIKKAETLSFRAFVDAYDDLIVRGRDGKLTADDFAGTTASLTNPGGIGTVHSMPRLTVGQGTIVGVGALDYPAEFQGASQETVNRLAISKVLTLTSTYDHRVIQGAGSGEFLKMIHGFLL